MEEGPVLQGKATTAYEVIVGDSQLFFVHDRSARAALGGSAAGRKRARDFWYGIYEQLPFDPKVFARPEGVKIEEFKQVAAPLLTGGSPMAQRPGSGLPEHEYRSGGCDTLWLQPGSPCEYLKPVFLSPELLAQVHSSCYGDSDRSNCPTALRPSPSITPAKAPSFRRISLRPHSSGATPARPPQHGTSKLSSPPAGRTSNCNPAAS